MDSPPSAILFSPGPHDTAILLCACGNQEVTRQPASWATFLPDFEADRCHCLECGTATALTYNDDPRLHFRRP